MFFGLEAAEGDRDTASGEGGGEASGAGKGFGTKDGAIAILFFGRDRVVTFVAGARLEETQDGLGVRGTQEGVPVVEQQSGPIIDDAIDETGGVEAGRKPGFVAEHGKQAQANRLARWFSGEKISR